MSLLGLDAGYRKPTLCRIGQDEGDGGVVSPCASHLVPNWSRRRRSWDSTCLAQVALFKISRDEGDHVMIQPCAARGWEPSLPIRSYAQPFSSRQGQQTIHSVEHSQIHSPSCTTAPPSPSVREQPDNAVNCKPPRPDLTLWS